MTGKVKKLVLFNLPYLIFVYLFDKLCQGVRLAPGADASEKLLHIGQGFEKTKEKISEQQKRLRSLEAQLVEEENLEIVRMVKAVKMDNRELTAFLKAYASGLITLPEGMMEAEASADPGENEMEDTEDEE